jgi:hypothetical protein
MSPASDITLSAHPTQSTSWRRLIRFIAVPPAARQKHSDDAQPAATVYRRSTSPVRIATCVQVNVELVSGWLRVTQPGEVEMYAEAFARLAAMAVYGNAARALVNEAIGTLGRRIAGFSGRWLLIGRQRAHGLTSGNCLPSEFSKDMDTNWLGLSLSSVPALASRDRRWAARQSPQSWSQRSATHPPAAA